MADERAKELIKRHEALRLKIYRDTENHLTGGWGHKIVNGVYSEGDGISESMAESWFNGDFNRACQDYSHLGVGELDEARRAAILDMLFNLGLGGLMKFEKFLAAVGRQDWIIARFEMLKSLWAKQVKSRAEEDAQMMLTGKFSASPTG